MVVCLVAVGAVYPITRCPEDYPPGGYVGPDGELVSAFHFLNPDGLSRKDAALKPRYDAHIVSVSTRAQYQAAYPGDDPVFEEVVVASETQMLPIAVVYFQAR